MKKSTMVALEWAAVMFVIVAVTWITALTMAGAR